MDSCDESKGKTDPPHLLASRSAFRNLETISQASRIFEAYADGACSRRGLCFSFCPQASKHFFFSASKACWLVAAHSCGGGSVKENPGGIDDLGRGPRRGHMNFDDFWKKMSLPHRSRQSTDLLLIPLVLLEAAWQGCLILRRDVQNQRIGKNQSMVCSFQGGKRGAPP